jgi:hypothetical protein
VGGRPTRQRPAPRRRGSGYSCVRTVRRTGHRPALGLRSSTIRSWLRMRTRPDVIDEALPDSQRRGMSRNPRHSVVSLVDESTKRSLRMSRRKRSVASSADDSAVPRLCVNGIGDRCHPALVLAIAAISVCFAGFLVDIGHAAKVLSPLAPTSVRVTIASLRLSWKASPVSGRPRSVVCPSHSWARFARVFTDDPLLVREVVWICLRTMTRRAAQSGW